VSKEKSDVRLALVEYRDHPPQDETFVTKKHDFTDSVKEMKNWLEGCSAQGGGDAPEAVSDALHDILHLSWREKATKICVLISDAPPHGLGAPGDGFPNGFPNGIDPLVCASKMAEKGITLYSVGCEPAIMPYKEFFAALAYKTGGQYVSLRNADLLAKVIIGSALEEISLEKLMAEVEQEVDEQFQAGVKDEAELAALVQSRLKAKGVTTNQLKMNKSNLDGPSKQTKVYSGYATMAEMRSNFKVEEGGEVPMMASYSSAPRRYMSKEAHFGAPPPMAMAMKAADMELNSGAERQEATYSVERDEISYVQSERLVQKALNRKKH
jgi:hypothetical protein